MTTVLATAMTEDELLSAVCQLAALRGWRYHHIRNSRSGITQGHAGFPDLVMVRPPRLLFVELKAEKGRLSRGQEEWLGDLTYIVEVHLWRPEHWLNGTIERVLA